MLPFWCFNGVRSKWSLDARRLMDGVGAALGFLLPPWKKVCYHKEISCCSLEKWISYTWLFLHINSTVKKCTQNQLNVMINFVWQNLLIIVNICWHFVCMENNYTNHVADDVHVVIQDLEEESISSNHQEKLLNNIWKILKVILYTQSKLVKKQ